MNRDRKPLTLAATTISARALSDLGTIAGELARRGHPGTPDLAAAVEWAAAELAAQILVGRMAKQSTGAVLCYPGPMTAPAPHHGPTANGGTPRAPGPDDN